MSQRLGCATLSVALDDTGATWLDAVAGMGVPRATSVPAASTMAVSTVTDASACVALFDLRLARTTARRVGHRGRRDVSAPARDVDRVR